MAKPLQSPFLHLFTDSFLSPHLLLNSAMVMRSDHCCLLEMPKMILMHLWWNVFSRFSCRLSGIQHSAPYRRTERTHTLYILFLVDSFRSLSRKTAFLSAPKAFDACATFLLTSASIFPELSTKDPRYENSSTASGIRYQVSYLDWGTFSHRLFLQAPSKQKGKEKSTKQRQRSVKCESIGSSIVSQSCSIKIN